MNGIINTIIQLKRVGFRLRLVIVVGGCVVLFVLLVPDLVYDISISKEKSFTIEQLNNMKEEDIPRYLSVKDIQLLNMDYVETKDANSKALKSISYPVFSTDTSTIYVIVVDENVKQANLDIGAYFNSIPSSIRGKYNGVIEDTAVMGILKRDGYNIAPRCIEIERGTEPLSAAACLVLSLIDIALVTGVILSFASKERLYGMIGQVPPFEAVPLRR